VLAGLLWLLDRWQVRRGNSFKSGLAMHFGWLVALCYLGALTHPLLDMLTTYSVQLYSPLSARWYHADSLFIVDVWVWLVLLVAIDWSRTRERHGLSWTRGPQIAIALVLAYIGANLLITEKAQAAVRDWAGGRPAEAIFASPPPAFVWRRDVVWREVDCYRRSRFDPFAGGFGKVSDCQPTNMDEPLVRQAIRDDKSLRKFLKWSILPQADIRLARCQAQIAIGDARYGEGRRSRLARETVVPIPGPDCLDGRPAGS
jgi:inner membrane protein